MNPNQVMCPKCDQYMQLIEYNNSIYRYECNNHTKELITLIIEELI